MYGNLRNLKGDSQWIPFRQLGQYEDVETGLYYNRFRYYSPETGQYISKDPIGLAGNNPNLYAYVHDSNTQVDPFGLLNIALGIEDFLDDFAKNIDGQTWKQWAKDDVFNWKSKFLDLASTKGNTVHFNLDGVDISEGLSRHARGIGGATDWELFQLKMDAEAPIWDVKYWKTDENGVLKEVKNPFKCT
nr:RHS repeat-associated core domain-containing protein [Apibacter sp. HY039]